MPAADLAETLILIVDDDAENRDWLAQKLTRHGYQVVAAASGEQALEIAQARAPDLILLDIMMTGIDGYETCQRFKANPATSTIPVIFTSALTATKDKVKAFGAGGADYIPRPFQEDEVLARVRVHLSLSMLTRRLEDLVRQRTLELAKAYDQLRETEQARARLVELFADELTDLSNSSCNLATAVRLIAQVERGSFPAWLSSQLKKREWSMRELAKRMNYNHSTVSRVISGEQVPSRPFCKAVAAALDVALSEVLDHAGPLDDED